MKKRGPGRLTKKKGAVRDDVEEALALLFRIGVDLDETALRVEQAMRRSNLVSDVLEPAVERVEEIKTRVSRAKELIGDHWAEHQSKRWSDIE